MKNTLLSCLLLFCIPLLYGQSLHEEIKPYVDFLKQQKTAKEYILELFDKYDIVVLCERDHAEITQYEFIQDLISDHRFISKCGNILFETCAENFKPHIDNLLFSENLPDSIVRVRALNIIRDMSFWPLWNCSSVLPYLEYIYRTNQSLDSSSKIKLYPLDRTYNWCSVTTSSQIEEFDETEEYRDSLMAVNTIKYLPVIFAQNKKALIIQNHIHAFRQQPGWYMTHLHAMTDKPIANVFIHNMASNDSGIKESPYLPIQEGKWDAAFISVGEDFGFDLTGSPFGKDNFDYVLDIPSNFTYSDIFIGMIYYKPVHKFIWSWGTPQILNGGFDSELSRRYQLFDGSVLSTDTIKKMYGNIIIKTYKDNSPQFDSIINHYLVPKE